MQIVDLDVDDDRWASVLPVLRELRPGLTADSLRAVYAEGHPQGYRFTALMGGGHCAAVAGWRIMATVVAGRKLYVDDLVTASAMRSTGAGARLLTELERRAREAGCTVLDLDSGVHRFDAHRFYLRERMHISSHHFAKPLA